MEAIAVDVIMILQWTSKEKDRMAWTELIWFRVEISVRIFEHGNESSGSIPGAEFLH